MEEENRESKETPGGKIGAQLGIEPMQDLQNVLIASQMQGSAIELHNSDLTGWMALCDEIMPC